MADGRGPGKGVKTKGCQPESKYSNGKSQRERVKGQHRLNGRLRRNDHKEGRVKQRNRQEGESIHHKRHMHSLQRKDPRQKERRRAVEKAGEGTA